MIVGLPGTCDEARAAGAKRSASKETPLLKRNMTRFGTDHDRQRKNALHDEVNELPRPTTFGGAGRPVQHLRQRGNRVVDSEDMWDEKLPGRRRDQADLDLTPGAPGDERPGADAARDGDDPLLTRENEVAIAKRMEQGSP
jgi:hypothetical protein